MRRTIAVLVSMAALPTVALAEERVVGGSGDAYATIGAALADAVDGDVVTVRAGTYDEALVTEAEGVTIRAATGEVVIVTASTRVLDVQHARTTVEGLVLDAGFDGRVVRVEADDFTLRDAEVRNANNHCVDLRAVARVTIERAHIHHCLASSAAACASEACRVDAHGVVGGQVRGLHIVDTEIDTFSGDALQLDADRGTPQWSDVVLERCVLRAGPLASAIGGYAAGVTPAENAIDTKTNDEIVEPATLTVIDTIASGFRDTLIGNAAAFNLKENVVARFDRLTVFDSEIAFRVRGATSERPRGARVTIDNVVVYDVDTAVRYEDGLAAGDVVVRHVTIGGDVAEPFDDQSALGEVSVVAENVLVLGAALPAELTGGSSLAVDDAAFADAAAHDYHLASGGAIDAATASDVTHDRDGNARPVGAASDVGAYEACGDECAPAPDAGVRDGGVVVTDAATIDVDAAPPSDASVRVDGGASGETDGGCGCRAGRGRLTSGLLPIAFGLALFVRRRRAR